MMLGITLVLFFILMIMNSNSNGANIENFDPVVDAIQLQLQNETPDQLKGTIKTLQQRLIDYGYAPDLNSYIKVNDSDRYKISQLPAINETNASQVIDQLIAIMKTYSVDIDIDNNDKTSI